MKWQFSLRTQAIIGVALIELVMLVVLLLSLFDYLHETNETQINKLTQVAASNFAASTKDAVISNDLGALQSAVEQLKDSSGIMMARVLNQEGLVLAEAGDAMRVKHLFSPTQDINKVRDGNFDVASPITVDGMPVGNVQLSFDVSELLANITNAKHRGLMLAAVEILLVALFSYILGNYLTKRLSKLAEGAKKISQGELGIQLPIDGSDEISRVTLAFNEMSAGLAASTESLEETVEKRTKELETARDFLENILFATPSAMMVSDIQGKILLVNKQLEGLFGYSATELVGQPVEILMPMRFRDKHVQMRSGFIKEKGYRELFSGREFLARHKDGRDLDVAISLSVFDSSEGSFVIGVILDVTDRKRQEHELKKALEKAEIANRAKSNFLATMSHELRTPLNVIVGLSSLLDKNELNTEQTKDVQAIEHTSKELLSIINEILDFTRIEAGEMALMHRPFYLNEMLDDVCVTFGKSFAEKQITLDIQPLPDQLFNPIIGDADQLKRILINLIGNALKFTRQGSVRIATTILVSQSNDPQVSVRIEISDTGIGMSEEQLATLFTPFSQGDNTTTRQYGGSGLGLSIVKRIVDLLGGAVHVNSHPGKGSCFQVDLPFELMPKAPKNLVAIPSVDQGQASAIAKIMGQRVLVVDDSEMNLMVIDRQLTTAGAIATLCNSGMQALETLKKNPFDFDVILMDMQMPDLDGCATTAAIRSQLKLRLPIVALTAGATTTEKQRAFAVGMNAFLTKPIAPEVLIAELSEFTLRNAENI